MAGLIFINMLTMVHQIDDFFREKSYVPAWVGSKHLGGQLVNPKIRFGPSVVELPVKGVPRINVLSGVRNDNLTIAVFWATTVLAFLVMIGFWTRVSSILLAILFVSLHHRNPLILYGMDTIMRVCVIYLAIGPAGASCSLDRLIRLWKGKEQELPKVSLWPQRLIAFQMAVIYFTTVWDKWYGSHWRDGTATWYPYRLNEFARFPYPEFLREFPVVTFTTYGTLIIELALASLVFARPLRKAILLAGLGMHGIIEYTMNIPLFGYVMCSLYISHYEGEEIKGWAARLGQRLRKVRAKLQIPEGQRLTDEARRTLEAADLLRLLEIQTVPATAKPSLQLGKLAFFNPILWLFAPFKGILLDKSLEPMPRTAGKRTS